MTLTFGSAFAGIGGFELGLEKAGWECEWQIENNKACNKILEKHWPNIKRYGDIENVKTEELEGVTLICGGFPCQDLSVAGKRKGLSGGRSGLFWELVRVIQGVRPKWILIENVPGFLSSHKGRDFAIALQTLAECGYGLAWRILDSQYFGVPQCRRRVFIVGYFGAMCPPEILFESEGNKGDIAKSGKSGENIAHCLTRRTHKGGDPTTDQYIAFDALNDQATEQVPTLGQNTGQSTGRAGIIYHSKGQDFDLREYEGICPAVTERWGTGGGNVPYVGEEADPDRVRETSGVPRRVDLPVCFESRIRGDDGRGYEREPRIRQDDKAWTVQCADRLNICTETGEGVAHSCPDSPRYRALGNAVTVQVAEWIGRRIKNYEDLYW